ncbi:hypothetical protein VTP01DRAFT_1174 [Rhizomucor pusillus]|uniref:uncharacterized protein n=1 Tax=Rhizomucor pusillus TaxID=4840 RepID=UPI0037436069
MKKHQLPFSGTRMTLQLSNMLSARCLYRPIQNHMSQCVHGIKGSKETTVDDELFLAMLRPLPMTQK